MEKNKEISSSGLEKIKKRLEKKKKLSQQEQQLLLSTGFTILHAKTVNSLISLADRVKDLKNIIKSLTLSVVILFLIAFWRDEILYLLLLLLNTAFSFINYLIKGFPKLSPDNAYMVVVAILLAIVTLIGGYLLGRRSSK